MPSREYVSPELPKGYDFDALNADVLLHSLSFHDGRLRLPDGMSYRVLVLPQDGVMSPEVLRKIKELVTQGATVVGARPRRVPGLRGYPREDGELNALAAEVWGDCDGKTIKEKKLGVGRILCGRSMREILSSEGIGPDFEYQARESDAALNFVHRTTDELEIYFVINRKERIQSARCNFRVGARQPELWDPVTGERRAAKAFNQARGRTTLPLEFAPFGSLFVVFSRADRARDERHSHSQLSGILPHCRPSRTVGGKL